MRNFLFLSLFLMLAAACRHEPVLPPGGNGGGSGKPCSPDSVYFSRDVLPILVSNCAKSGCHDAASREEGIVLDSYNNVMATGDVRPGRPGNSDLYEVLLESDPDKRMPRPPADPLSAPQVALIRKWIEQGAQNLSCDDGTACDTASVTFSGSVMPLVSTYCRGCHSGAAPGGGILLTNYDQVKGIAVSGFLMGVVTHSPGFKPMPQGGAKLSACNIAKLRVWIRDGMKND